MQLKTIFTVPIAKDKSRKSKYRKLLSRKKISMNRKIKQNTFEGHKIYMTDRKDTI